MRIWVRFAAVMLGIAAVTTGCNRTPAPVADPAKTVTDITQVRPSGSLGASLRVSLPGVVSLPGSTAQMVLSGTGPSVLAGNKVTVMYQAINGTTGVAFDPPHKTTLVASSPPYPALIVKALVGAKVGTRIMVGVAPADQQQLGKLSGHGVDPKDSVIVQMDILEVRQSFATATGKPIASRPGVPVARIAAKTRPTIVVPNAVAPKKQVVQTTIKGPGAKVTKGKRVTITYCGRTWSPAKYFDCSWGTKQQLVVGSGRYLAGFENGLLGQTAGSRVVLVLPPDEAFGLDGYKRLGIKSFDTLVYVVDILDVQ